MIVTDFVSHLSVEGCFGPKMTYQWKTFEIKQKHTARLALKRRTPLAAAGVRQHFLVPDLTAIM